MSSTLRAELQNALNEARRARDRHRTDLYSMTLSEVHNREIEDGREADDDVIREVLARARKRRSEAAEQMRAGGREELALREEKEAELLAAFLPKPLTETEVRAIVREILGSGVTDVGPLMGMLMPRLRGRFDGKAANAIVREELGG